MIILRILKKKSEIIGENVLFRNDLVNLIEKSMNKDFDIGLIMEKDISFFSQTNPENITGINMLRNADICFVARDNDKPIHHTCVALKSFIHPRINEMIRLEKDEAYIYGVETYGSHRGYGIAPIVFNYINHYLKDRNIKTAFSHIWIGNKGSMKTFLGADYISYGKMLLIKCKGEFFWIVQAKRRYFTDKSILRLPSFRL